MQSCNNCTAMSTLFVSLICAVTIIHNADLTKFGY
jgi:hypothetical protein